MGGKSWNHHSGLNGSSLASHHFLSVSVLSERKQQLLEMRGLGGKVGLPVYVPSPEVAGVGQMLPVCLTLCCSVACLDWIWSIVASRG